MRPINEIILHTTATTRRWMEDKPVEDKVVEIRRWHTEDRGWRDIGYHYVIDRDGSVGLGRPLNEVGAHVEGHNVGTIGIALVGGYGSEKDDEFSDHYTDEQARAVNSLIDRLTDKFPISKISGHNDYANKACPGFNVAKWLETKAPIDAAPTPTEGKSVDWYRWRLAEIRDMAQKALEKGNK